ncbi:MAG: ketosynthase chain-length factor [Jatrophihabitans sp.]
MTSTEQVSPEAPESAAEPDRILITGIGGCAPNGLTIAEYWDAVLAGRTGIGALRGYDTSRYPARLAGQIIGFDAESRLPSRLLPQTDRVTRLALVAAEEALADAGVDPKQLPEYDMGVVTSNACGGFEFTHVEIQKLWTQGSQHVSVYESFAWFYAVNTGQISIKNGMRGPSGVLVAEQAGGLDALGQSRRNIRGGTGLVLSGGVESALDPWGWVSHLASGRISTGTDPATAYLPFDPRARGYLPGEGGAILVLEGEQFARRRGASKVYGELTGYAATFDPKPGSDRPPGLQRAIRLAIEDAGLSAGDIDVVFADCSGVPALDEAEAEAIGAVFGPHGVAVAAPKSLIGRLYSGGPPLDVAAALLGMRDSVIPPCSNQIQPDRRYQLDLVTGTARQARLRHCLVIARGYGGFNAAVVVSAPQNRTTTGG